MFWGDAEVGAYAAAYKLFDTVLFLSYALVAAAFPSMSEAAGSGRLKVLTEGAFGLLSVVYVPYAVVAVLAAPELVELVFGPSYVSGAAPAFRLLALAPLIFGFSYVGGTALVSATRTQGVLVSSLAAAAVSVGLGLVLVPSLGAEGAALSLVVALAVEAGVVVWYLRDVLGSWRGLLAQLAQPVLACGAVVPLLLLLRLPVLVELALAAVVYLCGWLALARRRPPSWLVLTGRARPVAPRRDPTGASTADFGARTDHGAPVDALDR
jgi:O-antigen/teichoic acid export membrane protein